MSEAWKPELDLVKQNGNLQFPANVSFNFIFWEHLTENIPSILPHMVGSDILAVEIPHRQHEGFTLSREPIVREPEDEFRALVNTTFNVANIITGAIEVPHDAEAVQEFAMADDYVAKIALGLAGSNIYFTPLDDWDSPIALSNAEDKRIAQHLDIASRDNVSLKKLSSLALEAGADGSPVKISVLFGANHSLLETAAKRLGAKTERIKTARYSDSGFFTPSDMLARLIRFGKYGSASELSPRDREIYAAGQVVWYLDPSNAMNLAILFKKLDTLREDEETWLDFQENLREFTASHLQMPDSVSLASHIRTDKNFNNLKKHLKPYTSLSEQTSPDAEDPELVPKVVPDGEEGGRHP